MTDGEDAMTEIEMRNGMRGIAVAAHAFYEGLVQQGFNESDALKLTSAWIAGSAGGYRSS